MEILGRVHHGAVILDDGICLPEGAAVRVLYPAPAEPEPVVRGRRIRVPLVRTGQPGTLHLTGQRIAEILDDEDASPRH